MASLENAGHRQLFWENDFAQLIDRFPLFVALGFLQLFLPIEDVAEIAGRIDRQLVANVDVKFSRELDADHGRFAIQIERSFLDEFFQFRNHFFFLDGIDAANERRQALMLVFDNHWPLDVGRRRDNVRRVPDFHGEIAPVAQHVVGAYENVRVPIHDFLPQLAIEPGHDRNHDDQHGDAEHDADHRDQSDDRDEGAFRIQIPERKKETKREYQSPA